ncbi:MAG: hypothetical protein K2O36_03565, partial [Ruminococcus sp.]|nr:hypothetical protein [Ruminococcus sp.]
MTGNQIDNYQELSKEIDKVIQKKQAEALLNAALANSADLLQEQERLKQEHRTAVADRENAKLEWDNAKENYKAIKDETGISSAEFVNRYGEYFEKGNKSAKIAYYDKNGDIAHKTITREDYQLADAVERTNQEYQKALTNEALSREAWDAVSEQTKQLYEALALKESGEYKEATNLMLGESSDFNAETATEDEMLTEYRRQKKNLQGDWRLYRDSKNQSEIDDYLYETVANIDLGQKIGTSLVPLDELLDAETISHLQQLANKNFNLSVLTEFGKDSDIDITEFLGNDYSKIFSNQIQEDYNVDDMLEWIGNSEKAIAKESWEDFKTYVYKEIEKNEKYDITPILKSAKKAGIDVGEAFGGDYMDLVQKQINEGLDPTELIKWFSETDEKAAKYFKENYKDVTQTLIDEGYDPTQMLLQFTETDKEFAKNFKENGIDVVQNMLDKGFNPIGLMQWFFNNKVDITKSFTDKMKKEFEKTDYSGIKLEGLFNHLDKLIQTKAAEEADVYGKYFTDYVNQYLYKQKVDFGEIRPNSQWDADLYNGNVNYALHQSRSEYKKDEKNKENKKYSQFATGGYISAGNKGIVAEAGPELLEIMNGGVKITPLNRNSRNTAVSDSTAGQKIFY